MSHALLSPSSAERWLNCPPSARFEQQFPDRSSQYADQGSLAHKLGELLIRQKLKLIKAHQFNIAFNAITKNALYDNEMLENAENYSVFVIEQYNAAKARNKDAQIFLEQKLDLTAFIEEGFGTGDTVIIADGVLDIT